uniref:Uncharacterized protein n=1 Tax=Megaselia scalaris TaxID=36166 RepID=T1GSV9_MEGSC
MHSCDKILGNHCTKL